MKKFWLFIFLLMALTISPLALNAAESPKIVVWDLAPRNINAEYAQELTSILVSEVAKVKKYEVYSQDNVRTIAGWTSERMKLGCTDTQCLLALGQMDIAKLVSGSVGKIGNRYSVSLSLFNTQSAKSEDAISEFCRTEDELIELVQHSARKLLGITAEQSRTEEKAAPEKVRSKVAEAPESCPAPQWKVGDNWTFKFADGTTRRQKVVGEEKDFYLLESDGGARFDVEKSSMNAKFQTLGGGKKENVLGWVAKFYNFPLFIGKRWDLRYAATEGEYLNEWRVERMEDIYTPAGNFRCFKVNFEQRNIRTNLGGWNSTWYSPQTKVPVKREFRGPANYWGTNPWRQDYELVRYDLK